MMATKANSSISKSLTGTGARKGRYCDEAGNVQWIPSGPEAIMLQPKAGYMCATFPLSPNKLFPCKKGRSIYVPGTYWDCYALNGEGIGLA
jgi:hypothetical protein